MTKRGFSDIVKSDDRKLYRLPPGEYYRQCNLTIQQILDTSSEAAKVTKLAFAVRITEGSSMWRGLEEVTTLASMLLYGN